MERRFGARFAAPDAFHPIYHSSAFSNPVHPVITNHYPDLIEMFRWGLIPSWVKDDTGARTIRLRTLNARSETLLSKPAFRSAARKHRCLVLVDGFYEWREVQGKKYPYYIKMEDHEAFALAGIWNTWQSPQSGEETNTFSIVTTQANPLLEVIHNTKKRMPVILARDVERRWVSDDLDPEEMGSMLAPYPDKGMEAYTVSRAISTRGADSNVPSVMEEMKYPEIEAPR